MYDSERTHIALVSTSSSYPLAERFKVSTMHTGLEGEGGLGSPGGDDEEERRGGDCHVVHECDAGQGVGVLTQDATLCVRFEDIELRCPWSEFQPKA